MRPAERIIETMLEDARAHKLPMLLFTPGHGQMTNLSNWIRRDGRSLTWGRTDVPDEIPISLQVACTASLAADETSMEHILIIDDTRFGVAPEGDAMRGSLDIDEYVTMAVTKCDERVPENMLAIACVHEGDADRIESQCTFETTRHKMPYAPMPLWFRVPEDVMAAALAQPECELEPTMLCFEDVYQAVATSLSLAEPTDVIDVGGYMGVQGWLFEHAKSYTDIDLVGLDLRCELPENERHVCAEAFEWLEAHAHEHEDALFVCSAVPDARVREAVRKTKNHLVWYPGLKTHASGEVAQNALRALGEFKRNNWERTACDEVRDYIERYGMRPRQKEARS